MWSNDESTETIWKWVWQSAAMAALLGQIFFPSDFQSFKPDYVPATGYWTSFWTRPAFCNLRDTAQGYPHGLQIVLVAKYFEIIFHSSEYVTPMYAESIPSVRAIPGFVQKPAPIRRITAVPAKTSVIYVAPAFKAVTEVSRSANKLAGNYRRRTCAQLYMEGPPARPETLAIKASERKPQEQSLTNGSCWRLKRMMSGAAHSETRTGITG